MQACPGCHRYVRVSESSCPFCSTSLRSDPAPAPRGLAAMVLVLGLAIAGCTDDGMGETDGETDTDSATDTSSNTETASDTAMDTSTDTTMTTTGMDETTTTTTDDGTTTSSGETYAGPDPGDWTDTGATDDGTGTDTSTT